MDLFGRNELNDLFNHQTEPCVSIYLPTERTGRDFEQNPIRLRNLLGEAETKLVDWGMRRPDARAMLEDASRLAGDMEFWKNRSDGMALFFSPQFYRHYRLPIRFDESITLNRQFYLKPLLPLLHGNGRFYILALSQNEVRLFRATRNSMDEILEDDLPENMREALMQEDVTSHLTHKSWGKRGSGVRRTKTSLGAQGGGSAVFHGQGSDENMLKKDLAEFFQQVDRIVNKRLNNEYAPMVLACVDYEAPIYREHNHYPNLIDTVVLGNPEGWNDQELHRRAWEAVEPHFRRKQDEELQKFNKVGADRISHDLKEIAEAAETGRVEAMFIARNGTNGARRAQSSPADEMLDATAAAVLRTGGDVFSLPPDDMPQDADQVAAVFRYAVK